MIYPPKELSFSADYKETRCIVQTKEKRKYIIYESTKTPNLEIHVSYSRAIGLPECRNMPVPENELQKQLEFNCAEVGWCMQAKHLPEEIRSWAQELLAEGFMVAGILVPATPESQNVIGFQMLRGGTVKGAHTKYIFAWYPDSATLQDLAFKWRKDNCTVVVKEVEDSTEPLVPISSNN